MKLRIKELRSIIQECLIEWAAAPPTKPSFEDVNSPLSPKTYDVNQYGQFAKIDSRENDDEDESPHLREPLLSKEDCYGPVPPVSKEPYASPDPTTKGWSIIPKPSIP